MSLWGELLPGIIEDVTLTCIVPKLPWTAFYTLASVSRAWEIAIKSRTVYNERIRTHSRETVVAVKHRDASGHRYTISLYSMREKKFYQLPPVPLPGGISRFSPLITSNGTLSVIGADSFCKCTHCADIRTQGDVRSHFTQPCTAHLDTKIYTLDVAAQGQWTESERFPVPNMERIIHPFFCGSRMENESFIRFGSPSWFMSSWLKFTSTDRPCTIVEYSVALKLDKIPPFRFAIDGKMYMIQARGNYHDIYVCDRSTKTATPKHSIGNLFVPSPGSTRHPLRVNPLFIIPVNNELFAIASWSTVPRTVLHDSYCLIQSIGFGSDSRRIVWQKVRHPFFLDSGATLAMCPVLL